MSTSEPRRAVRWARDPLGRLRESGNVRAMICREGQREEYREVSRLQREIGVTSAYVRAVELLNVKP